MSKKLISVALAVVSGTAMAWGVACSNSTTNPTDGGVEGGSGSSGGSSSSGSGSGGSSGSSSGTGSSSGSSSSSSGPRDGGDGGGGSGCTATATGAAQALIDNQSAATGTAISFSPTFSPTNCAGKGTWFDYNSGNGTIAPAQGAFVFSPLPPGLPADAGVPTSDASTAEGGADAAAGASGPKAACVYGVTGSTQYNTSGVGLNLAAVPNPDGGNATQVPVNASTYTGVQFWIWGAGDSGTQSVIVQMNDKQETAGLGVCDNTVLGHECGGATSNLAVMAGWHLVQIPFAQFAINPGFGQLNETMIDPTSLTQFQVQIQQAVADAGAGVPFDFCVFDVSFY